MLSSEEELSTGSEHDSGESEPEEVTSDEEESIEVTELTKKPSLQLSGGFCWDVASGKQDAASEGANTSSSESEEEGLEV